MDLDFLQSLGINSEFIAVETERALGLRFSEFTPEQCDTWRVQTLCLKQYALTPTYERAAQRAGVSVTAIEEWERNNVLGFVKRKEVAELEFSDMIQVILLKLTLKSNSPSTLLLALLSKHLPEKYGMAQRHIARPTKSKILRQVVEKYNRLVREKELLLDEEERLVKSQAHDSTATQDTLPAGDVNDRRAPEDKQFEPVWNWSLDGSVRTRNN